MCMTTLGLQGNFVVAGRLQVILQTDNTIKPIDLQEEEVEALANVDLRMVPFLEDKVRFRCFL